MSRIVVDEFDYIVVGAGSAGCVLAGRLSEDPTASVLLLEAGDENKSPLLRMPAGWARAMTDPSLSWLYKTAPSPRLQHRQLDMPRGRVLGGSSSINGLVYIRGQAEDYDDWAAAGATGWGWQDVLPYFLRSENNLRIRDAHHGQAGPLVVSDLFEIHPLSRSIVMAGAEAGLPLNDDFNGAQQEGIGYFQLTGQDHRRCSAATAYLDPARQRPNLKIVTQARVTRITLNGKCAEGVEYRVGKILRQVVARREVLLAGGAINSPQLLMLSGIGPGEELQRVGQPIVHDAPGVGRNLQDHLLFPMGWRLRHGAPSLNARLQGFGLLGEALRFLLTKRGAMNMPAAEVCIFCKSDPALARPDIQFHCLPVTGDLDFKLRENRERIHDFPGMTLAPCALRPQSRGRISLTSHDPLAAPIIDPNYLAEEYDWQVTLAGLRWGRRIAASPTLRDLIECELYPGSGPESQSDEALRASIARYAMTVHHPVGTCRMGSDAASVVDPELRVRGIDRLRVIDASVMPTLPSGNTNAPTIMIAERMADILAGKRLLRSR